MALMYASGDGLPNLEDVQDRVQLVDLLDGASDAACVAVLRRLDALPMPCRSVIELVAKKLARVRKHETRAIADKSSQLIAKWCAHYGSAAPASRVRDVVDLTAEPSPKPQKPVPRWKQIPEEAAAEVRQARAAKAPPKPALERPHSSDRPKAPSVPVFEDDEVLRNAARQLKGGPTRVSKVSQAPSTSEPSPEALLEPLDREALREVVERAAKQVSLATLVRAANALRTRAPSAEIRAGCWRAACYELSRRTTASGLDSPKVFDALLDLLRACGPISIDTEAEQHLEHFVRVTSSETRKRRAERCLIDYRSSRDPFIGSECVMEGAECIVLKAVGQDRYEVKFAGARKFAAGGRWCGTYKKSELQVLKRPRMSNDKEEEFDVHADVPSIRPAKKPRVAEPVVADATPEIGGLGTRTTKQTEEPLCNDVLWSVEDEDQCSHQLHPRNKLPTVPSGHRRVFFRKATVTLPGMKPFMLDRAGVDDVEGCVMPKVRIAADEEANEFDEYIVAVHDIYYDEPLDDPDAEVELMLVFAYMYTHRMLLLRDCPVSLSTLDRLHPPFAVDRELAESVDLQLEGTSVELVRGSVRVAWRSDDATADYFRVRDLDGDQILKAKSSPQSEVAARARKFISV